MSTQKISKGFAAILVIILGIFFVVIAITAFSVFRKHRAEICKGVTPCSEKSPASTPLTQKTTKWETYTSSINLFTIEHPSNLKPSEKTLQSYLDANSLLEYQTFNDYSSFDTGNLEVKVGNSVDRFNKYSNAKEGDLLDERDNLKLKSYTIDGFPAVEYGYDEKKRDKENQLISEALKQGRSVTTPAGLSNRGLLVNKNGSIVEISTSKYAGDFKNTFDQILVTFKFNK